MPEPPNPSQAIAMVLEDIATRVDENQSGHVVAELAIITLLIDLKLVTIEQVCERLELIQSVLPERHQSDGTKLRTRLLTEWLRGHARPEGPRWTPQVIEGGKPGS